MNNTTTKDWFGILVILGLIAIPSVLAYKSFPRNEEMLRMTVFAYAQPTCAYTIKNIGGELIPVNQNGKRIGLFERYQDGTVQLTTGEGFSPAANECMKRAGYADNLGSVKSYFRPTIR